MFKVLYINTYKIPNFSFLKQYLESSRPRFIVAFDTIVSCDNTGNCSRQAYPKTKPKTDTKCYPIALSIITRQSRRSYG